MSAAVVPPPPTVTHRLAYIDAVRGFAALWVFLVHVHGYWLGNVTAPRLSLDGMAVRIMGFGGAGVDLFVVLSGFCLSLPVAARGSGRLARVSVRGFFRRRAYRLLPAYYVALVLVLLLETLPAVRPLLVPRDLGPLDWITHLTLTFPFRADTLASVNGSLWSISLEATLYLAFPALLLLARRVGVGRAVALTVGLAVLSALVARARAGASPDPLWFPAADKYLPARWAQFAIGMLAATVVRRGPGPGDRARATAAVALGLPVGLMGYAGGVPLVSTLGFGAFTGGLLVLLAQVPPGWFARGPGGWLAALGTISYSFYLLHQPVLLITGHWGAPLDLPIIPHALAAIAVAGSITVALAAVFYHAVEHPFLVRGSTSQVVRPD